MVAVIRQNIIKKITDRPGDVVYRDEIAEATGYTEEQVGAAVLGVQKRSSIGDEIETVVRGRAWRYRPSQPPVTSSNGARASDPTLPLTSLIREYLISHAGTVVWASELSAYTGHDMYKVKVGVNNMRRIMSNQDVSPYVTTVVPGQAWRFDPPPSWRVGSRPPVVTPSAASSTSTRPTTDAVTSAPVARTSAVANDAGSDRPTELPDADDGVLMFELVGRTDDALIVKDDEGALYRVTRL